MRRFLYAQGAPSAIVALSGPLLALACSSTVNTTLNAAADASAGQSGASGAGTNGGATGTGGGTSGTSGGAGAGGGGTSGMGGSAGRGGGFGGTAGMGTTPKGCTATMMIDDMEDGDNLNCPHLDLGGHWWTNKGTGGTASTTSTISPATGSDFPAFPLAGDARVQSDYGMSLSGSGFGATNDDWAQLGMTFVDGAAYDISGFTGVTFWAKNMGGTLAIRVSFGLASTLPPSAGGSCTSVCWDNWGADEQITASWQAYTIPFSTLAQAGWGAAPKDLQRALDIEFRYAGAGNPASFHLLVDDLSFY